MTALDTLKTTQARIETLRNDAAKSCQEADELEKEICLAIEVAKDYEDKAEEKKMYDSEALATLLIKITSEAGGALDEAIREFAESASLEIPEEIRKPEEDDVQAVEIAAA